MSEEPMEAIEAQDCYQVVALDPGGTTGWCVIEVHPDAMNGDPSLRVMDNIILWRAGQFEGPEDDQIDLIMELIESWPYARLVTEMFVLRTNVRSREVFALERMNAVLRWAARPRYFVEQQPSLAMTTITDERQKAMKLWLPGQEHARDAVKHGFTFLKRRKDAAVKAARVS